MTERYLNALVSNLNDTFPADDLDLLESLNILLNPVRYPNAPAEIQQYGLDQLQAHRGVVGWCDGPG